MDVPSMSQTRYNRQAYIQVTAAAWASCVTLNKFLTPLSLRFLTCKREIMIISVLLSLSQAEE